MNKRKGLNMEQKRNLTGWAFLLPASILIFVFCFYPMVQALILSFQKGTGSAVQPAGFANYARILKDATFQQCLFNTIFYFVIQVPIMRSTYGAAMTVTFMNAWNSYLWPKIIFQNNASITMPMLVANLKSGYSVDYGMLMLGVLICTLPTAIIFLCLQKSFANGITGAVK